MNQTWVAAAGGLGPPKMAHIKHAQYVLEAGTWETWAVKWASSFSPFFGH